MSYMNRVWMAATVAVVNNHTDQSQKLKSGLKSLNHGKKRFFSSSSSGHAPDGSDLRPFSGAMNSEIDTIVGGCGRDDMRKPADETLRQVMYLNCWGPS